MDQRMGTYTTSTKSVRWPFKMLSYVLDVTRVNAQSVYCLNTEKDPRLEDSFRFGWQLAMSLVKPQMANRLPGITNRKVINKIKMFLEEGEEEAATEDDESAPRAEGGATGDKVAAAEVPRSAGGDGATAGVMEKPTFSYSSHAEQKKRCAQCVHELPIENYKEKHVKMGRIRTQCSQCSTASCAKHSHIVCLRCSENLQNKPVNNDFDE